MENAQQEQEARSKEEAIRRMTELIAELELRHQVSYLGRLSRNKTFW